MKSIASAPGKIILFGEHFVVHGTKAILAAIDKRVTVTTTTKEIINPEKALQGTLKINSQLGMFEIPMNVQSVPLGALSVEGMSYEPLNEGPENLSWRGIKSEFRPFVYLVANMFNRRGWSKHHPMKIEITIDSDIPVGVGLGSSSACCVAAAASISASAERNKLSMEEIVSVAEEAERTIFPDTSGADCAVCTYGGMIEYPSMEKFGHTSALNLIISNSMIPHNTKNSVEKVSKFKENNEERFSELCELETKLIDEVIMAMKNNNATALGLKMSENQKYLEEIQISNDTLRDMMSSLKEISLGTKITGAGDGGCIISLVEDKNLPKTTLLPKDKEYFSAKIDTEGVVWSVIE